MEIKEFKIVGEHHDLVMMLATFISSNPEYMELFAHAVLEANAQLKKKKNEQKP